VADPAATGGRSQIADYALIGDCETAALVDRNGSIDWLCWPRFDSDACFAALIGDPSNGYWKIFPAGAFKASRRYRPGTLVLETLFETDDGAVALVDFMPPRGQVSDIVRLVEGRRGAVAMRMELVLRFGYGLTAPWVKRLDDQTLTAIAGPSMAVLRTPAEIRGEDMRTVSDFTVREGQTVPFVLTHQPSHMPPASGIDPEAALAETEAFWGDWLAKCVLDGPYAQAVARSLITLKAMTFAPTGALIAAPTTSLPEQFGGERNWDYRYSWIRDSTQTLLALMNTGY
jgi:GH15 family glucan-1,4-alpha-glucosidase